MHTKTLHKQNLNTEELLQTEAGMQRNVHKQKLFYTEDVLHRSFYTQKLLHQKHLHREVFTHRSFYIQKLLCKEAFVQRSLYPSFIMSLFHHHSPSVTFISLFSCSFGQLPPSFSFHVARCSVCPRFALAPSAAKQTKRERRNK